MPLFEAQGRRNPVFGEGVPEGTTCLLAGTLPRQTFNRVVGDKIHFGAKGLRSSCEQVRLRKIRIDAVDQNILEGNLLGFAPRPVFQSLEERGKRPLLVDWHDLTAHLVARTVEGNREADAGGDLPVFESEAPVRRLRR